MENDSEAEVSAIADGYVRASEALAADADPDTIWNPESDPDQRAYDTVHRTIRSGPATRAWALSRAVIDAAPDERLGVYAAGPLEDCVRIHGAALVDAIEQAAASDERFRWALGGIWLSTSDLPDDILRRVVRASGDEIKVLEWLRDREGQTAPRSRAP